MRRVRESLLPWKSSKRYFLVCVCGCESVRACMWVPGCVGVGMLIRACSLANPACNSYAPYCDVICGPLGLHHIFRHYLINGAIFGKKLLNIKCVFLFSLQLLSETFSIIRTIWRDIVKRRENVFMQSTCYFCQILRKLEFPRQICEKKKKTQISSFIDACTPLFALVYPQQTNQMFACGCSRLSMRRYMKAYFFPGLKSRGYPKA